MALDYLEINLISAHKKLTPGVEILLLKISLEFMRYVAGELGSPG